jgi:hypothetical protein
MKIKLWIIYKNGIGFSKILAEILQDRFEEFIDVDVGKAKMIDPAFVVEEKLDYLIIGDIINDKIPSLEIQDWLHKYRVHSEKLNLIVKSVSGFYVTRTGYSVDPIWESLLRKNVKAEIIFPPILHLKMDSVNLNLEKGALELVKAYSHNFIEIFTNSNIKLK